MMLRLKFMSATLTLDYDTLDDLKAEGERGSEKKYFSSSTPSRVTKLILRIFPPICSNRKNCWTCKPVKILITMQEERGEGRLFQHHKIRVS